MAMRAGDTVSPNVGTYCLRRTNGVARLFRGGSFSEPQSKTPRLKTRATGKMRPTRRECGGISFSRHAARSQHPVDRKSTRLNSSHANISYAVFCLKKKEKDWQAIDSDRRLHAQGTARGVA